MLRGLWGRALLPVFAGAALIREASALTLASSLWVVKLLFLMWRSGACRPAGMKTRVKATASHAGVSFGIWLQAGVCNWYVHKHRYGCMCVDSWHLWSDTTPSRPLHVARLMCR